MINDDSLPHREGTPLQIMQERPASTHYVDRTKEFL
ncbi:hypothetical protein LMG28727_04030 [Paraburkholderia kirstenboschensis]|nr:hypothetical protein LMG28727_04030 [Paraburkholderia kirstenboschensis]